MTGITTFHNNLPAKKELFLQEFNPAVCLRKFRQADTPALALQSEAPTLAQIRKEHSEDFLMAYIAVWIVNLNDFVNFSRKMTPEQIEETAIFIYQDYYYLNLADINLIFRKVKKGEFGQLFAEIDGVKILSWFAKYASERASAAADIQINRAANFKETGVRISNRSSDSIKNLQSIGFYLTEQALRNQK